MGVSQTRLQRWESASEWPLALCAVDFLVLYSIDVLAQPQGRSGQIVSWLLFALYVPFVVDYLARLYLTENRFRWFVRHPLDLAVVTLPFLRPLRFLRLVALVRVSQRALGDAVRGRIIAFTAFSAALLVYGAALAELQHERYAPGSHITTFPDALWWAVATLTTVGYGDTVPVTTTGRIIAALLMIGGICLIGVATATVAHWIITEVGKEDSLQQAATVAHIEQLRAELVQVRGLVEERSGSGDDRDRSGRPLGPLAAQGPHQTPAHDRARRNGDDGRAGDGDPDAVEHVPGSAPADRHERQLTGNQ